MYQQKTTPETGCTGCIRRTYGGHQVPGTCLQCRRLQYGHSQSNMPDRYEADPSTVQQSMPAMSPKPGPHVKSMNIHRTEKEQREETRIRSLIDQCQNQKALEAIARYAGERARLLRNMNIRHTQASTHRKE